ncbi:MAG: serine hydrolase domain-containing protein, partial [Ilumatobacteraceae bacterium]
MGTLKTEIDPGAVGLDARRLARLDRHFARYVDDGLLPGWLVAVSRHGQLAHVSTYGQRDLEAGLPVETDTIWRIYSMTKPITAVAALVAFEQGLFELGDFVRWYIPTFKETKV